MLRSKCSGVHRLSAESTGNPYVCSSSNYILTALNHPSHLNKYKKCSDDFLMGGNILWVSRIILPRQFDKCKARVHLFLEGRRPHILNEPVVVGAREVY
jgi:hypothetical protein